MSINLAPSSSDVGLVDDRRSRGSGLHYKLSLFALGNSSVGKTSLLHRFCHEREPPHFVPTTSGIDFMRKVIRDCSGPEGTYDLHAVWWDTAGQERFRSISRNYYRRTDALLLVYDITDRETFDSLLDWIAQIRQNMKDSVPLLLLGNKLDLVRKDESLRRVTTTELARFAEHYGITRYAEVSAWKGTGVDIMDRFALEVAETSAKLNRVVKRRAKQKPDKRKCCPG